MGPKHSKIPNLEIGEVRLGFTACVRLKVLRLRYWEKAFCITQFEQEKVLRIHSFQFFFPPTFLCAYLALMMLAGLMALWKAGLPVLCFWSQTTNQEQNTPVPLPPLTAALRGQNQLTSFSTRDTRFYFLLYFLSLFGWLMGTWRKTSLHAAWRWPSTFSCTHSPLSTKSFWSINLDSHPSFPLTYVTWILFLPQCLAYSFGFWKIQLLHLTSNV